METPYYWMMRACPRCDGFLVFLSRQHVYLFHVVRGIISLGWLLVSECHIERRTWNYFRHEISQLIFALGINAERNSIQEWIVEKLVVQTRKREVKEFFILRMFLDLKVFNTFR